MSAFTGSLTITEIDAAKDIWRLEQPLRYEVGSLGSGRMIEIPAGFESDGASIPWPVSIILTRWGPYRRAAIVHDYLVGQIQQGSPHPEAPSRKDADRVFNEAMAMLGISAPIRVTLFAGASVGGHVPWLAKLGTRL